MRALLIAPLLGVLGIAAADAPRLGSLDMRGAVALWESGRYRDAYKAFLTVARDEQFGRSPRSVYYLLTAGCRSEDAAAIDWSRRVLRDYAADRRVQAAPGWGEAFGREVGACGGSAPPGRPPSRRINNQGVELDAPLPVNKLTMYFKRSGAGVKPGELPAASSPLLPYDNTLPGDIITMRKAEDRASVRARLGVLGTPTHVDRDFILIGAEPGQSLGDTPGHVATFLTQLDTELGLRAPENFLFVIVYPDASSGGEDSLVPSFGGGEFSLGFSDPRVLTSYVLATPVQHGTAFHELTHQLVVANIGDMAPEWLNEGLACLYEQTALINGRYEGRPNWRGAFLRGPAVGRPTLAQIVAGDPFLDGKLLGELGDDKGVERREIEEAAQVNAAQRYLMLYLQQKGLLSRVVNYYRTLSPGIGSEWPLASSQARLRAFAAASGIDPAAGNAEFQAWITKTVGAQPPATFEIPLGPAAKPARRRTRR